MKISQQHESLLLRKRDDGLSTAEVKTLQQFRHRIYIILE